MTKNEIHIMTNREIAWHTLIVTAACGVFIFSLFHFLDLRADREFVRAHTLDGLTEDQVFDKLYQASVEAR